LGKNGRDLDLPSTHNSENRMHSKFSTHKAGKTIPEFLVLRAGKWQQMFQPMECQRVLINTALGELECYIVDGQKRAIGLAGVAGDWPQSSQGMEE
jgi:hypothetical protein